MTVAHLLCRSPAKVNLVLAVLGRRDDGFHELRTVFQTVSLADLLEITVAPARGSRPQVDIVVEGPHSAGVPADSSNLVVRAATAFLETAKRHERVRLRLTKRIPAGGGLGGGSSNAASILLGLELLFPNVVSRARLFEIAAGLGADVPYFLVGGTALGLGRGDQIVPLPELPRRRVWLVLPQVVALTAQVFGARRPSSGTVAGGAQSAHLIETAFAAADPWPLLVRDGFNHLEDPALRVYPEIAEVAGRAGQAGASMVRLSGSGSTLVVDADQGFRTRFLASPGPPAAVRPVHFLSRRALVRFRYPHEELTRG